jgi:hypothetical protein
MQVFMRAYRRSNLKGKPVDILCPLDSFKIIIEGETCILAFWGETSYNSNHVEYYMSENQYNTLLLALKNPEKSVEGHVLDASIKD